uniref:Regulator of G-protein signaling 12 n=1 Tax=Phallusia mammillata TaxID=59560 RepID=A0A6F9DRC9_9ASCI|nr:regulator of G-protein signaling 12 [Phallusia mammillata]
MTPPKNRGERKKSSTEDGNFKHDRQLSDNLPSMVMVQSIVAYLGTVEMPMMDAHMVAQASLDSVRGCVQRLRLEQHIHQRVLFKVTQSGAKLYNADGDMIAIYHVDKLMFSAPCPDDGRFFCLVTLQDAHHGKITSMSNIQTSCHIFMVDPEISSHNVHLEKANRFGIQCSTNTETGECVEFPKTPRSILSVMRLLQSTSNEQLLKTSDDLRNTSVLSNTTNDSGIVDQSLSTPHYHILDYHPPHTKLTRGESSLPPVALAWTNNDKRKISVERKHSSSSMDEGNRFSPKNLFTSDSDSSHSHTRSGHSNVAYSGRNSTLPSNLSSAFHTKQTVEHHKLHSSSVSSSRLAQQNATPMLSQQNLHRHDNRMKHSHVPPPMHKLSMGKYRMADLRAHSDQARHQRRVERGKPPFVMPSHQSAKREGKAFANRFVAFGKAISRSTENVAVSDEDPLSGASSVESLASNASLPSCINGSFSGNFDYGYHRSSLRGVAPPQVSDVTAGRISHWAVSFDRLLDDPLGVKYFKHFLCKEFSEENILFWEACEGLRTISADDVEKMKHDIKAIYDRFLAHDAPMPVNIDSQGQQQAEEALTSQPHPNIFLNQQNQVYTLMKLDSYSRFLKSPLYRQCMVSEMEGRPLPLDTSTWSNTSDTTSVDSSIYSRPPARSVDAGSSSFRRKGKKSKGSKKSLFGFKNRPKGGSFQRDKSSAGHDSSRDSSGSESYLGHASPLVRSGSLPTAVPDFPDASRVCHVTLWDNTTTVIYAKKSGVTTVAEALDNLCERRGVKLSAVEVFMFDDDDRSSSASGGSGRPKRPLSLDLDVSVLASRSIVLERRALFRLDMLPVRRSVGVKARPGKNIGDALKSVLTKYNLQLCDVTAKISGEEDELILDQPVSNIDGLRIILEQRHRDVAKKANHSFKEKKDKVEENKPVSTVKSRNAEKQETEELLNLMSLLQSSKMNDQRGLISKADLVLPDFLKQPELATRGSKNGNNNNSTESTGVHVVDNVVDELSPYAISSILDPSSVQLTSDTSGRHTHRKTDTRRGSRGYVELSAQPKSFSTFKPSFAVPQVSRDRLTPELNESDPNDTTIVEDPDIVGSLGLEGSFDPEMTLVTLSTPPHDLSVQGRNLLELSMADFSPPTPISTKVHQFDHPGENDEETKTIMV